MLDLAERAVVMTDTELFIQAVVSKAEDGPAVGAEERDRQHPDPSALEKG